MIVLIACYEFKLCIKVLDGVCESWADNARTADGFWYRYLSESP